MAFFLIFPCLGQQNSIGAEEFAFSHQKGDKYRVISTVDEFVYINRRFSHTAHIINRIAFSAEETKADGAVRLIGDFSTSSRFAGGRSFVTDKIYRSEYWLTPNGRYDIAPEYFMPTVRHVPSFPKADLKPGDTWSLPAEERHDFRDDFGIPDPYVIPLMVKYIYEGPGTFEGKEIHRIRASYTVLFKPEKPRAWNIAYPVQISAYSEQLLYWSHDMGGLAGYEEVFKFIFELSDSRIVEYRGSARARVIEAELMDRKKLEEEIKEAVAKLENVTVTSDERGVTIALENIQFHADSARLLPGESAKINTIAAILKQIEGYDILISGHTALAGTIAARQQLSTDRARVVAEMLIQQGARTAEAITVIGYGAEKPIADNSTPEGMARNRRVEITLLEN